ncbi:WHG domain protein [Leptospira yanagawae serovar Saopaulo str. Sao Paulo = ATCC 700523]|uniref:WHG domain protein n=1 Tax=Leptospira yanagawae serovar Saopaulo str. Sao Paulo = ATCC 700523 TaxID=1249483 RepID=A0A5E8HAL2_9LEPT|nr:TetR/AcrR family transcriptional regulator [Leptospira yanagawae]EOQ87768.1 WHG domain protein [Leptospira yanagawae serovar Saopaulo str. Sao Paulo = ATCC 700523]
MIQERRKVKKGYHHGNLREAILNESIVWIRKKGVESLSLREIAKKIGVTHSAPNKHFAKKESLLASLIEMGFEQFKQALIEGKKDIIKNPKEAFIGMGVAYVKFANENPEIYRLMFSNHIDDISAYPACEKAGFEAFEVLLSTVILLQDKGIIKKGDPKEISYLIWSFTHGYVMLQLDKRLSGIESKQKQPMTKAHEESLFENLMNHMGLGLLV